jgi:predicted DsbA family dithiol-disulfide isomerase
LYKNKFLDDDFAQAQRARISREGEKEGIKFFWSDEAVLRNSRPCHRLLWKVYNEKGADFQTALSWKLYQGVNEEAIDVADPETLSQYAEDVGAMSKAEALSFLKSDEGNYELDHELELGKRLGIEEVVRAPPQQLSTLPRLS